MGPLFVVAVTLAPVGILPARVAWADGAFPASQSILLPRENPQRIIVAATFGLIISDDNGATWQYTCEVPETRTGRQYVLGARPQEVIHAVSDLGAAFSSDESCTWHLGGGELASLIVSDVFPDRVDPNKVFALAAPETNDISVTSAYKSTDGGVTYGAPIFTPPMDALVTGIESAVSAPGTVYLTYYETPGDHPRLMVSHDDGATFAPIDIESKLGAARPFIAAVDPQDALKLYLRTQFQSADGKLYEALAISPDEGASWTMPVVTAAGSTISGFLRRESGTLLVLMNDPVGNVVSGKRSTDGGATFTDWPLTLHARGIAERGAELFVAAEDILDGAALWSSTDEGATFKPRLRFRDIAGVRACVRQICATDCDYYSDLMLFPKSVCTATDPPDGGGGGGGGGGSSGCACGLGDEAGHDHGGQDAGWLWLVAAALGIGRSGRRRGRTRARWRRPGS